MNYLLKSILSLFLIVFAVINFFTMFELLGRKPARFSPEALRRAHRYSGYIFIILFLLISYFCLTGVINNPFDFSARAIVHIVLAITIFILLVIKFLIIKFYRGFYSDIQTLGKNIFVLVTILFFISAGYYFLLMYPKNLSGILLVQNKCGRCHTLERIFTIHKSEGEWRSTVIRMAEHVPVWISANEKDQIINYLAKSHHHSH